ncbi:zinc finger protein 62-like [Contarinia nasturtii]|uniref:zinc finger protein 62-like n=1 Tax=Contarinia nasturtii TaxID=265458 RepID=UPI0012D42C46|nr:zinc finger protein 62-like [Contarinia nasturtii]
MAAIKAVHECLFCPQTFGTAFEKDDHVLEHFAQEICTECNQHLIRIGRNLYTLHNAVTCIRADIKSEAEIALCPVTNQSMCSTKSQHDMKDCLATESICVENVLIKPEPYSYDEREYDLMRTDLLIDNEGTNFDVAIDSAVQVEIIEGQSVLECSELDFSDKSYDKLSGRKRKNRNRSKCDECGKWLHVYALKRHKKVKHQSPICTICTKSFPSEEELLNHQSVCMLKLTESNKDDEYKCDVPGCEKVYHLKASLQRHQKLSHDPDNDSQVACEICNKVMNSLSIPRHMRVSHNSAGEFVCKICSKVFKGEDELVAHKPECSLRRSNQEWNKRGVFECEICKKTYSSRATVYKHKQKHHNPNGLRKSEQNVPVPCHICGKLMFAESLKKHIILQHHEPGTHICRLCVKIFPNEEELANHQQECDKTGEFECHVCKKGFFLKASLVRHVKTIHDLQREKEEPIACDECGKMLSKKTLKTHKRIKHSPPGTAVCTTCARIFPNNEELMRHKTQCLLKKKRSISKRQKNIENDTI